MILIADSGSSKIDWRAIKNNIIVKSFTTSGLNPYFVTSTLLEDIKREILEEINIEDIRIVNFYCAGCLYEKNKINISEILNGIFKNADINVETDLLAAARALYNKEKGIVVVLGTGANTCLYDGDKIINNIPSLGYFFGDEGGGDYLGKLLISDYLKDKMPLDILKKFEKEYDINKYKILDNVYNGLLPNKYLASFVKFMYNNIEHKYVYSIVEYSFKKLFIDYICKYKDWETSRIRSVGSVAYYFRDILNKVANSYNTQIDRCIKEPSDKLAEFHMNRYT